MQVPEFAKLNIWERVVVEMKVVGGWASMRRLSFANSSTCTFELAESRMVGGLESAGRLDLAEKRVV